MVWLKRERFLTAETSIVQTRIKIWIYRTHNSSNSVLYGVVQGSFNVLLLSPGIGEMSRWDACLK